MALEASNDGRPMLNFELQVLSPFFDTTREERKEKDAKKGVGEGKEGNREDKYGEMGNTSYFQSTHW